MRHRGIVLATSGDSIPVAAYKAFSTAFARIFHPIMIKASLTLRVPVQWGNDDQCEVPKHKAGGATGVKASRGVAVSDPSGKCYRRSMRKELRSLTSREDNRHFLHQVLQNMISIQSGMPLIKLLFGDALLT